MYRYLTPTKVCGHRVVISTDLFHSMPLVKRQAISRLADYNIDDDLEYRECVLEFTLIKNLYTALSILKTEGITKNAVSNNT